MKGIYEWLGRRVHHRHGSVIFALLVLIEGFFIVPVSTLLAFYSLENRPRAFFYAFIATVMSALGAVIGYMLGILLWQAGGKSLITYLIAADKFDILVEQFKDYQAWTIFAVALTPMPFKLLTLTAGFLRLPLFTFIGLSVIARGIRFFGIATAIHFWGEKVHFYLNKYFYYVVAGGIVFFAALLYFTH